MTFKEIGLKLAIAMFILNAFVLIAASQMQILPQNQDLFSFVGGDLITMSSVDLDVNTDQTNIYSTTITTEASDVGIFGIVLQPIAFIMNIPRFIVGITSVLDKALFGFLDLVFLMGMPGGIIFLIGVILRIIVYVSLGLYLIDILAAAAGFFR